MREQMTADEACDRAHQLAMELLAVVGFVDDGQGVLVGNVSVGIAGGALGLAAGRLMAAVSDESFLQWMSGVVCGERNRTRAEHLTEQ